MHLPSLRQLPLQGRAISRNLQNLRATFPLLFFLSNYLHPPYYYNADIQIRLFILLIQSGKSKQYIMNQINKKRTQWRNNIRRKELEEQKRKIRKEVCIKESRMFCINAIEAVLQRQPRNVLVKLGEEMDKQDSGRKGMFAENVWCYLTSPHFANSKRTQVGLGNLVVKIYHYLSDHSKLLLACPTLVTSLLRQYSRSLESRDTNFFNQLGTICTILCFQTLRQSNFHINLTEQQIRNIIKNAHSTLSFQDLSVLMPLLLTLQTNQLDNSMRSKLNQIQRRLIHLINNHQNRIFYLRLLTAISYFLPLQHHQLPTINTIFDQWRHIGFQLVLRLFSSQSKEESLDWQLFRSFLLSCQQNMQTKGEIRYYLIGICNLLENACGDSKAVLDIFHLFLSNRLHHYVKDITWDIVQAIVYQLFREQQLKKSHELLSCALTILQKYGRIMEKQIAFDFSNRLLLQQYTQQQILSALGEQRFMEFWQLFQESQNGP